MKLGLAIADFTWPGAFGDTLRDIAVSAEDAGFSRIAVMDHLWQIGEPGLLAKIATTLDVLSGGRAMLGIGTGTTVGRDYDEIEKTVVSHLDPGDRGERADAILRRLERLAGLGVDGVIGTVRNCERLAPLEAIGRRVMPAAAAL